MGHIAICEDDLFDAMLLNQVKQFFLRPDGDSAWVKLTSQFRRIDASFDVRDLSRSESHDLIILISAKERIEVVEVTSCRAHDKSFDWHRVLLLIKPH